MASPSRRTFLTSTTSFVSLVVAGCVSDPTTSGDTRNTVAQANQLPAAQLEMGPIDDPAQIGTAHARRVESCIVADCRPIVERAVEKGSVTVDGESPPIGREEPLLWDDGSVYRLNYEVAAERPATRYFWKFDPVDEAPAEETVSYENLPSIDREKFRLAGLADGSSGKAGLNLGTAFVYANADREESALVPTPDRPVIAWGPERRARFTIKMTNEEDATLKTYRYTATQLAPSAAAYGRDLRDRYAFELSGLSDAERDIVEQATERSGFFVPPDESPPDAFRSLVDRFRNQDELPAGGSGGEVSGVYLARYEGQLYWTRLLNGDDVRGGKTATRS